MVDLRNRDAEDVLKETYKDSLAAKDEVKLKEALGKLLELKATLLVTQDKGKYDKDAADFKADVEKKKEELAAEIGGKYEGGAFKFDGLKDDSLIREVNNAKRDAAQTIVDLRKEEVEKGVKADTSLLVKILEDKGFKLPKLLETERTEIKDKAELADLNAFKTKTSKALKDLADDTGKINDGSLPAVKTLAVDAVLTARGKKTDDASRGAVETAFDNLATKDADSIADFIAQERKGKSDPAKAEVDKELQKAIEKEIAEAVKREAKAARDAYEAEFRKLSDGSGEIKPENRDAAIDIAVEARLRKDFSESDKLDNPNGYVEAVMNEKSRLQEKYKDKPIKAGDLADEVAEARKTAPKEVQKEVDKAVLQGVKELLDANEAREVEDRKAFVNKTTEDLRVFIDDTGAFIPNADAEKLLDAAKPALDKMTADEQKAFQERREQLLATNEVTPADIAAYIGDARKGQPAEVKAAVDKTLGDAVAAKTEEVTRAATQERVSALVNNDFTSRKDIISLMQDADMAKLGYAKDDAGTYRDSAGKEVPKDTLEDVQSRIATRTSTKLDKDLRKEATEYVMADWKEKAARPAIEKALAKAEKKTAEAERAHTEYVTKTTEDLQVFVDNTGAFIPNADAEKLLDAANPAIAKMTVDEQDAFKKRRQELLDTNEVTPDAVAAYVGDAIKKTPLTQQKDEVKAGLAKQIEAKQAEKAAIKENETLKGQLAEAVLREETAKAIRDLQEKDPSVTSLNADQTKAVAEKAKERTALILKQDIEVPNDKGIPTIPVAEQNTSLKEMVTVINGGAETIEKANAATAAAAIRENTELKDRLAGAVLREETAKAISGLQKTDPTVTTLNADQARVVAEKADARTARLLKAINNDTLPDQNTYLKGTTADINEDAEIIERANAATAEKAKAAAPVTKPNQTLLETVEKLSGGTDKGRRIILLQGTKEGLQLLDKLEGKPRLTREEQRDYIVALEKLKDMTTVASNMTNHVLNHDPAKIKEVAAEYDKRIAALKDMKFDDDGKGALPTVEGKPMRPADDAKYLMQWMNDGLNDLRQKQAGMSIEELQGQYPGMSREMAARTKQYAAELISPQGYRGNPALGYPPIKLITAKDVDDEFARRDGSTDRTPVKETKAELGGMKVKPSGPPVPGVVVGVGMDEEKNPVLIKKQGDIFFATSDKEIKAQTIVTATVDTGDGKGQVPMKFKTGTAVEGAIPLVPQGGTEPGRGR